MTHDSEYLENVVVTAAGWDARLRSPQCTEADRAAFREWAAKAPEHAAAFERLQSALELSRRMADRAQIRVLRDDALVRYRRAGNLRSAIGLAVAASLAIVIGTAFFHGNERTSIGGSPQTAMATPRSPQVPVAKPTPVRTPEVARLVRTYRTGANERTEVRLDDGSVVVLNANTQMITRFTERRRDVAMLGGQAFFRVEKDAARPFVVRAGSRDVIAVGTAFEVRMDQRSLAVTLLEGRVTVKAVDETARLPIIHLVPNQRAIITEEAAPRVTAVDSSLETGWAEGRLYFDDTPLDQAVDVMNQQSAIKIELANRSLAAYRISGMFRVGGQSSFVEALQAYFPISAVRRSKNLIVLIPAPQRGNTRSKK